MEIQKKFWMGDFLFEERYSDVLQDFLVLGEKHGFTVVKSEDSPYAICMLNYNLRDIITLVSRFLSKNVPKFQLVTEPSVTLPLFHYKKFWNAVFLRRYVLGAVALGTWEWQKPQRIIRNDSAWSGYRNKCAVIVNSNKVSYARGELYFLRREVVSSNSSIFVYGSGWDITSTSILLKAFIEFFRCLPAPHLLKLSQRRLLKKPVNYGGTVKDKVKCMSQFEVALVIENSLELVTEKIHDAWFAGCFPVYVGPNLSGLEVPDNVYIQVEPDSEKVKEAIDRALATIDFVKYRKNLNDWLSGETYRQRFQEDIVWKRLFTDMKNALRSQKFVKHSHDNAY